MMVSDAQNEVVRSLPLTRRGATVPAVRREGALAVAATAVGALALGAVATIRTLKVERLYVG